MSPIDLIKQGVKEIVELLVNKEYELLEEMNKIGELSFHEVEIAIANYGQQLTNPPLEAYEEMDIYKVDFPQKYHEEYSIDFDLWTNGSKSDLTLSCDAVVNENHEVSVSIYSIHVL